MKYDKIIGSSSRANIKEIVGKSQEILTAAFLELSVNPITKNFFAKIGGDPLVYQLVATQQQYCDITALQFDDMKDEIKALKEKLKKAKKPDPKDEKRLEDLRVAKAMLLRTGFVLRTAATNGRTFFWNPEFIIKLAAKNPLGVRIVIGHEAWHAIFMHPARRGSRMPRLWNIAVDYRVNYTVMESLKSLGVTDCAKTFTDCLGEYIHLDEYAAFLRDPFNPPPRLEHFNPIHELRAIVDKKYKHPGEDKEPMYYADSVLPKEMKRPENVYQYLWEQIPRCPDCNKLYIYKKPDEYKELLAKIKLMRKEEEVKEMKKGDVLSPGQVSGV
jgi:hypothetical protein